MQKKADAESRLPPKCNPARRAGIVIAVNRCVLTVAWHVLESDARFAIEAVSVVERKGTSTACKQLDCSLRMGMAAKVDNVEGGLYYA